MRPYANLHLHSTHSDGKFTPEELVLLAKGEGYGAIALTDHDTVTGNEELAYYAKKHGLESIFGCEFSVLDNKAEGLPDFHFVAYDFDPTYPPMAEYLKGMAHRETDQTRIVFGWAVEKGDIQGITWEEVLEYNKGIAWLCNDHVYNAMLAKGLVKPEDYDDWFNKNFRMQRGLVPPAYEFLDAQGIIDLVHAAGGIILVAHPYKRLQYMDKLIEMGIDGLEVYHFSVTPEEQREALRIAYEKNLFIAGGTDHEGALGGMYESFENPEECPYYMEPRSFGTMEEHFFELKERKIGKREKMPDYVAIKGKQKKD
jgi:predicted metal-dependent phosphoesterase TrpH